MGMEYVNPCIFDDSFGIVGVHQVLAKTEYTNLRYVVFMGTTPTSFSLERIYWACELASKQRKMLMSRPKIKPV